MIIIAGLLATFAALFGHVTYGYGSKAPESPFFKNYLAALTTIKHIDCSGFVRLALYRASNGRLKLIDGSQNQRVWAEQNLRQVRYEDAARYMTPKRVFICFIKPFENGCGDVGHVWLLVCKNGKAVTLESHGGKGVDSRPWDTPVLKNQVYSCFEIPATDLLPA